MKQNEKNNFSTFLFKLWKFFVLYLMIFGRFVGSERMAVTRIRMGDAAHDNISNPIINVYQTELSSTQAFILYQLNGFDENFYTETSSEVDEAQVDRINLEENILNLNNKLIKSEKNFKDFFRLKIPFNYTKPKLDAVKKAQRYIKNGYLFKLPERFNCEVQLKDKSILKIESPKEGNHILYGYHHGVAIFYEVVFTDKKSMDAFRLQELYRFDESQLNSKGKDRLKPEVLFNVIQSNYNLQQTVQSGTFDFIDPATAEVNSIYLYEGKNFQSLRLDGFDVQAIMRDETFGPMFLWIFNDHKEITEDPHISELIKAKVNLVTRSLMNDIFYMREDVAQLKEFTENLDGKALMSGDYGIDFNQPAHARSYQIMLSLIKDIKKKLTEICLNLEGEDRNSIRP